MEKQPREALLRIAELSKDELCEIYDNANSWKWDRRLGEMPEGFESLPNFNWKWYHSLFRRKSKEIYIGPVCEAISKIVGEKQLLKYHHLHNLGRSSEEFERFWNIQQIEKVTGILLYPFEIPNNVGRNNSSNNS